MLKLVLAPLWEEAYRPEQPDIVTETNTTIWTEELANKLNYFTVPDP